jgi:signal transduction histidine kinase/ActR/RegA family two-component response regulator
MTLRTRRRLLTAALAHAAASIVIILLYSPLGQTACVVGVVAVFVGALCFGLRGGLAASVVQLGLNNVIMQWVVDPPQSLTGSSLAGIVFFFVLGAVVGNQRDLSRRLREELLQNERLRAQEKETLAAIPDAMIRVGLDGTCRLRGVEAPGTLQQVLERALGHSLTADRQTAVSEKVEFVRSAGLEQGLALDFPGSVSYDMRFLPAADQSVLIVTRDVSEQRRLLRRVTSAENLASLGTLAAGLAHEINNPLTYVITSVSTVGQSSAMNDATVAAEVTAALDGCWRIRDLVRDILGTTSTGKDSVDAVFVPEVIDAALTLVTPQVRHRATIRWTQQDVPCALAHRTKMVQVVVNLVVNASQAFQDSRASVNEIHLRAYGDGEHVIIEVRDNGPGMDEATRQRAIEPFFTTKEPGQGSGLGLFLCCSIVESLGGALHIESELGRGTTVVVRLPAATDAPASRVVRRSARTVTGEKAPPARVLVVDDEPEIRRALGRQLRPNHSVTLCANGIEALRRLVAGERFDVILCDVLMPEMTGIELYDELERRFPEQAARVQFLTGGATSETARLFVEKHADRVVRKPFQPGEVEAALLAVHRASAPSQAPRHSTRP